MCRHVQNLQRDIAGIVDPTGHLVVKYKYDAWDEPLSITGSLKTSLGELNPIQVSWVWKQTFANR